MDASWGDRLKTFFLNQQVSDLLKKTASSLCGIFVFFSPPFIILDLIRGTYASGILLLLLSCAAAFNLWTIKKKNVYYPIVTFLVMLPIFLIFDYQVIIDQQIIGVLWSYPFLVGFYFALPQRMSWVASACCLTVTTIASTQVFPLDIAARIFISSLIVCIYIALLVNIINKQNNELENQAALDPLTGIFNRKLLKNMLTMAVNDAQAHAHTASLLCIDLDNFKSINDNYGHHVGDDVLIAIANLLKKEVNSKRDKLFRLGGEEFLILLPKKNLAQAISISEAIRYRIEHAALLPDKKKVTASIGVSEYQTSSSWTQWMNHTDDLMYIAKQSGKNCVKYDT